MKTLVINSWSSSLKCSFFIKNDFSKFLDVTVEKIGEVKSYIVIEKDTEKETYDCKILDHDEALEKVLEIIVVQKIVKDIQEIESVGYRVVHGATYFSQSVIIDENVKKRIQECSSLAPLHNPINLHCIELGEKKMPHAQHVAVFDTGFHQTIPKKNYLYAIPKKYYEKYKIRKYGFHGISHQYVSEKLEEITWIKYEKVISCHIWNGASITALKDWKSINTSMWFTPVDGLVMWTRVGNIDPSAILFLQEKEWLSSAQLDKILNTQSWLLWLTESVWDIQDLEHGIDLWNPGYELALDIYISRIVRYIWSYIADLGWVDVIIFTAWVLENSSKVRKMIAEKLEFAWIEFDDFQNLFRSEVRTISTNYSPTRLIVIPTDEEMMIAKEVQRLLW